MTMTSKEKHLANTDIVIPQHAFVTFKFLTDFVVFFAIYRKMPFSVILRTSNRNF